MFLPKSFLLKSILPKPFLPKSLSLKSFAVAFALILVALLGQTYSARAVGIGGTCAGDRKSTRLNSSHVSQSRMPSSA